MLTAYPVYMVLLLPWVMKLTEAKSSLSSRRSIILLVDLKWKWNYYESALENNELILLLYSSNS